MSVPLLRDALVKAGEKLSGVLGGECMISVHHNFPQNLARMVEEIEATKFRKELQYSLKELMERSTKDGFTVILFELDGKAFAFDLGYTDDEDPEVYFGDSAATLIERKGVGAVLTALDALYSYEAGYKAVKCITEEEDDAGRRLVEYWGKFGFYVTNRDPRIGVEMRLNLTPDNVKALCEKYVG